MIFKDLDVLGVGIHTRWLGLGNSSGTYTTKEYITFCTMEIYYVHGHETITTNFHV